MKTRRFTAAALLALFLAQASGQEPVPTSGSGDVRSLPGHRFSVSTTYLALTNFGAEETNTHHYEIHLNYRLTPKDIIGVKAATWKLFAPMGIQMWDPLFLDETEFYSGRLREMGIGVTYQRFLWKGLFASTEILPLYKSYLDEEMKEIGKGFKLYTSWHLGYHVSLLKNRLYIEPQFHCNYWPVDTGTPQSFRENDCKWDNYLLFEPDLYIGINF
jgi:hypothetical protein